jgi:hypothetical protein
MDCTIVAQDQTGVERMWMRQWTVRFYKMREISWLVENQLASQDGLYCMDLVGMKKENHIKFLIWQFAQDCTFLFRLPHIKYYTLKQEQDFVDTLHITPLTVRSL